jgi:branched-chain amino acid transport system substrate-binding protein
VLLTLVNCDDGGGPNASRHLEIATLFAVAGADAATQLPAQYGVDVAVGQAHLPDGYTLSVAHENAAGAGADDPAIASAARARIISEVHALVNDAHLVGVIGPFTSGVATLVEPITNLAGLSVISPTTTSPGLTLQQYAPANGVLWSQLHPPDHPNRYFRTIANDVEQGQFDAYFASHTLGAKTAFVVEDSSAYSAGLGAYGADLAHSFTTAFTRDAGHTVRSFPENVTGLVTLAPLVAAIVAANPDLVFYGGVSSGGGVELKRDLVAAGYTKPLLSGDGVTNDPAWLSAAQAGSSSTYGSIALPEGSSLSSQRARAFVAAYAAYVADWPDNSLSPYSVMAYDAANTLIRALTLAIEHGAGRPLSYFRTQTGQYLAAPGFRYGGLTGDIAFDVNGDNAGQRVFSVYVLNGANGAANHWSFARLFRCSGSAALSCQSIPSL